MVSGSGLSERLCLGRSLHVMIHEFVWLELHMQAARILANLAVAGAAALFRAGTQAYRQALVSELGWCWAGPWSRTSWVAAWIVSHLVALQKLTRGGSPALTLQMPASRG